MITMALSSITHNFVLTEKDEIERFILAIETSMNDGHTRPKTHSVTEAEEDSKKFDEIFAKWERSQKN